MNATIAASTDTSAFKTYTVIYALDDFVRDDVQLSASEAVHCITLNEASKDAAVRTVLANAAALYNLESSDHADGFDGIWIVAVFEGQPLAR